MRHLVASLLVGVAACAAAARAQDRPLLRVKTIPMPSVEGRIDHLAVDVQRKRLFVAALGNRTLEVLSFETGERIRSIGGLEEPQGVAYLPEFNRILVASGGDGTFKIFDAETFRLLASVQFSGDADNLRYDARAKRVYVGYGDGAIGVLDASTGKRLGDVALPGHPESFQLERFGPRIFVNVPTARSILVIDRDKLAVVARWPLEGVRSNFPMALDEADHRLFVGCRHPATVLVFDTQSGKVVSSFASAGDADDLFYDAARKRLYLSGGEGLIEVFDRLDPDHYRRVEKMSTAAGARTSLFIPQLDWLCLAVPHRGAQTAEIRIFQPQH